MHLLGPHFHRPSRTQTVWCAAFALWLSAIIAWQFPYWHWHHHPWPEGLLHFACYLPGVFLLTYLGLGFLQRARPPKVESKNIAYIGRLDHLRFFAASLVIMYHYYHGFIPLGAFSANPVLNLCSEGSSGVDLFFVLSGFIFALIAHGNRIRYFDYLFSRIIRIYPLYLFGLVLSVNSHRSSFAAIDYFTLLLPVTDIGRLPVLPGFGHLWTVGLEFQFYLIFPFLAGFVLRNGQRYLFGLLALTVGLRLFYYLDAGTVRDLSHWTLLGRMDEFIAGMLGSWIYLTRRDLFSNPLHLLLAVGLLLGCMQWLSQWGGYYHGEFSAVWVIWPTVEGVFWAYLTLSYLCCRLSLPGVIDETLSGIGKLSFSIYVMHGFALMVSHKYLGVPALTDHNEVNVALAAILTCIPLAIIFALFTYNLIEKQFFVFRRRYVVPVSTPAVEAAAA